jgi:hypothetical protein
MRTSSTRHKCISLFGFSLKINDLHSNMAEREGFEPPVPVRVRLISSQVHSTGLCHLSVFFTITYAIVLEPYSCEWQF